jgi:hypothetical protein
VTRFCLLLAASGLVALAGGPATADPAAPKRDWTEEKCFRYARDWNEALRRFGPEGFSGRFVAGNAGFIRAGCRPLQPICPATAKDRKLADALAIRVVNEGHVDDIPSLRLPERARIPLIASAGAVNVAAHASRGRT